MDFMECDTCRPKLGSPTLCEGCLHNRSVISELTSTMYCVFCDFPTKFEDNGKAYCINCYVKIRNSAHTHLPVNPMPISPMPTAPWTIPHAPWEPLPYQMPTIIC